MDDKRGQYKKKSSDQPRIASGVEGLDSVLHGGVPPGQMYLIEGDPGTGKTTLAMQFMLQGAAEGQQGLYITLSETKAELEMAAESHGWNLDGVTLLELTADELAGEETQYTVFHPAEVELASTLRRMLEVVERINPGRVVLDSLSELRLLAGDSVRYRRQLLSLKNFFSKKEMTVLILDDRTGNGNDKQLQSIAHGVIRLEKLPRSYGTTRRNLEVLKLRGSAYREGFHDYTVKQGGMVVYPRVLAADHDKVSLKSDDYKLESNIPELNELLGGGLQRGTSNLIMGPTGAGKSTIAALYAAAAASRGEKAAIYTFDELVKTLVGRSERLGVGLERCIQADMLTVEQMDPAELSPGEFASRIMKRVEEEQLKVLVIDSLNGFLHAMVGETEMVLHLHELLSSLNARGVTTILTLAQHGLVGTMQTTVDVSYLADSVMMIRYFEDRGEVRQAISVLKNRAAAHEHSIRELLFEEGAIKVGRPLNGFQGVLTGVPALVGNGAEGRG